MWKCSTVQFIIKLVVVVLKKGSRRLPQVFLVPEPVSEPHTKKLCEAEEESDASDEAQHVPGVTCDDDGAGVTWRRVVGKTASATCGVTDVTEATTVQGLLHVSLSRLWSVPTGLQQLILLFFVERQTGAGDGKLRRKHHKQDDHVKEEKDLVVLERSTQSDKSHEEQEAADADDSGHESDAGHQVEPLPPGGHPDQEQTHQHVENI